MKTLSAIESFTGGLFAAAIVSRPGASQYFYGALVAYANEIKKKLGVDIKDGVINREVALALTKAGRNYFKTDICVSFTGNAGPYALENKAVGHIFIAINDDVYELHFQGSRQEIQNQAVAFALQKLNEDYYAKR